MPPLGSVCSYFRLVSIGEFKVTTWERHDSVEMIVCLVVIFVYLVFSCFSVNLRAPNPHGLYTDTFHSLTKRRKFYLRFQPNSGCFTALECVLHTITSKREYPLFGRMVEMSAFAS